MCLLCSGDKDKVLQWHLILLPSKKNRQKNIHTQAQVSAPRRPFEYALRRSTKAGFRKAPHSYSLYLWMYHWLYPDINSGTWRDNHSKALLQAHRVTTHGPLLCFRHKVWCWENRGVGKPPCLLHLTKDHVLINQWRTVQFSLVPCQSPLTYFNKNLLNLQALLVHTFELVLDPEESAFWWTGFACSRWPVTPWLTFWDSLCILEVQFHIKAKIHHNQHF